MGLDSIWIYLRLATLCFQEGDVPYGILWGADDQVYNDPCQDKLVLPGWYNHLLNMENESSYYAGTHIAVYMIRIRID